jgi:hypothetical protein
VAEDDVTHHDLVKEVLDKLLLQGSGGEQSVEIGTQELGDKVAAPFVSVLGPGYCAPRVQPTYLRAGR